MSFTIFNYFVFFLELGIIRIFSHILRRKYIRCTGIQFNILI